MADDKEMKDKILQRVRKLMEYKIQDAGNIGIESIWRTWRWMSLAEYLKQLNDDLEVVIRDTV